MTNPDWIEKVFYVDGIWCSSCEWSIKNQLKNISYVKNVDFIPNTYILKCSVAKDYNIEDSFKSIVYGYQLFTSSEKIIFENVSLNKIKKMGIHLAVIWFFSIWVSTLSWIGYLSAKDLEKSTLDYLYVIKLFVSIPVFLLTVPYIVKSAWSALSVRSFHVDGIIFLGILSTLYFYTQGTSYLDSTTMSLSIVFLSRWLLLNNNFKKTQWSVFSDADVKHIQKVQIKHISLISILFFLLSFLMLFSNDQLTKSQAIQGCLVLPLLVCPCLWQAYLDWSGSDISRSIYYISCLVITTFNLSAIGFWTVDLLNPQSFTLLMLVLILIFVLLTFIDSRIRSSP